MSSSSFTVSGERLHKCGVVFLPFWICDYKLHGKQYRAFLNDAGGTSSRVVGPDHVDIRTMQLNGTITGGAIALAAAAIIKAPIALLAAPLAPIAGYFIATWRAASYEEAWQSAGLRREQEREYNDQWKTQAYWQQQMQTFARVWQQQERRNFEDETARRTSEPHRQAADPREADFPDWRHMDDYELLGLERRNFQTSSYIRMKQMKSTIGGAFRAQAMIWHPDHNMGKGEAWQQECTERFTRILQAHQALRKQWAKR